MSGSPTDALLEGTSLLINQQCTLADQQGTNLSPQSPEAESVDRMAMTIMYKNGVIKGLLLAKSFLEAEHNRIMKPPKTAAERGAARAPYGRNRAARKQEEQ